LLDEFTGLFPWESAGSGVWIAVTYPAADDADSFVWGERSHCVNLDIRLCPRLAVRTILGSEPFATTTEASLTLRLR
jgi:hypothetical protein